MNELQIDGSFKQIPGYDNYLINSDGLVFSSISNRLLTKSIINSGYAAVTIRREGKGETALIHRLVALAFLGVPEQGMQVNHKDGDRLNNSPSNLEWCSQADNVKHSFDELDSSNRRRKAAERMKEIGSKYKDVNGERLREFARKTSKPVDMLSLKGEFIRQFPSLKAAQQEMKAYCIRAVISGKCNQSGGYKWRRPIQ